MNTKQNRSRFEVRRSSHLVAPHIWIEHPIARRSPSSSQSHTHHDHVFTDKYRFSNTNHTFYEDYYTYKINHFTIDHDCLTAKSTPANHPLHDVNHSLDAANHALHQHNCININIDYHDDRLQTTDCNNGALDPCNDERLHSNRVDDDHRPDREYNNCNIGDDEENEGDTFTFSTSVADSMEFFKYMKSSSSRHASEAGDTVSVMSPADELFEDGKIRPLLPPIIDIGGSGMDQPNCSNPIFHADHSTKCSNKGRILRDYDLINWGLINSNDVNAGEINQRLDQRGMDHGQHRMMDEAAHDSLPFRFMSLSAPASPAKEDVAIDGTYNRNEEHGISQVQSEISTNCHFKRCRSLTRAFPSEVNNIEMTSKSLKEPHGGRTGGGIMSNYKRRTTLEDFLKQEEKHTLNQNQEQLRPKTSHTNIANSCEALERPSLAPAPINLPQLWPTRESRLAAKKVRAPSPHVVHYTFQKAQSERLKRKTFLPYRPRLLGCLGYPP